MNTTAYHHTSRLDRVVVGVIVANAVVLIAGLIIDGHEQVFDGIDDAIVAFFTLELAVQAAPCRLAMAGPTVEPVRRLHHRAGTPAGGRRVDHYPAAGAHSANRAPRAAHRPLEDRRVAGTFDQ